MEVVQDRNRRPHDLEHPISSRSLGHTTTAIVSNTSVGEGWKHLFRPVRKEYVVGMDEFQTYDIESDLQDISGTPMMDLSVRPPKRIPPHLSSIFSHREISSSTTDSRDHNRESERKQNGD